MSIMKGIRFLRLLFFRAIRWLSGRISSRNYQILVSIIIGIVAGLVAVVLKVLVHGVRDWLYGADPTSGRLAFVFLPALGIVLTLVYTRLILRRPIDSGLSNLIYAISKKRINIPVHETYSHVISSSLTVGFGGSVGLEAPIVRTGSAIGANLARLLGVGRRKQTLFLACGAAAGISAIFNSPVAGVIFAFEVLVTDIAIHSFIPLLISAATAAVVAKILYYEKIFFLPAGGWQIKALPFYLLLGVAAGLMSVYVSRATAWASELLNKRAQSFYWRVAVGSAALGLLIFLMPPLFGEGYDTVNKLLIGQENSIADHSVFYGLAGNPLFIFLFGVFILFGKAIATSVTIAAGGNGGKFAPTMFTGATLGFVFAYGINQLGWVTLNQANFIAVAMGGLMSGVFKSPLTGIFLIAEITGGYELFIPLMIVSALSYFVSLYFEPHSALIRDLARKGLWAPSHERDWHILSNLNVGALMETNFRVLTTEMTLGAFVEVIAKSKRNVFPVVDKEGILKGVILLDDVRELMFNKEAYEKTTVGDLMHQPPATVGISDTMEQVMDKFENSMAWNLPVLDKANRYLGFVSKSSIFNEYRRSLIDRSKD